MRLQMTNFRLQLHHPVVNNPSSTGPVYIRNSNLVICVSADILMVLDYQQGQYLLKHEIYFISSYICGFRWFSNHTIGVMTSSKTLKIPLKSRKISWMFECWFTSRKYFHFTPGQRCVQGRRVHALISGNKWSPSTGNDDSAPGWWNSIALST